MTEEVKSKSRKGTLVWMLQETMKKHPKFTLSELSGYLFLEFNVRKTNAQIAGSCLQEFIIAKEIVVCGTTTFSDKSRYKVNIYQYVGEQ